MLRSAGARLAAALGVGVLLGVTPCASFAVISLTAETGNAPVLFGSGMVLQRDSVVPIWGTAAVSAPIEAEFVDPAAAPAFQIIQSASTTANAAGRWVVRFTDLPVGGPYEVRLYENGAAIPSVTLVDVLVGDVWLLSGQSNMQLHGPKEGDAEAYPKIRAITTKNWGQKPSGAAFYFGAQLYDALGIPIGLVNRARGDTALAQWLPAETIDDEDPAVATFFFGCGPGSFNIIRCQYYDQLIRPLERPIESGEDREGMALRGIVWWQGEKGEDKRGTDAYIHLFPAMIRAWRANLGQPNLPFVFHQLPSGTGLSWNAARLKSLPRSNDLNHWQPRQRNMYFRTLEVPFTSLMTSIDLEQGTHPRPFHLYGRRLGDAALGTTYVAAGEVALYPYSGPIYESAALEPTAGADEVRIRFRAGTADGLKIGPDTVPATTVLQGFAVCCDVEGAFVFADARIENVDEVVVSHADVATPTVVHYAMGRNARWANLFNGDERAAAPFSTELQPFVTQDGDGDGFWEPGPYDVAP